MLIPSHPAVHFFHYQCHLFYFCRTTQLNERQIADQHRPPSLMNFHCPLARLRWLNPSTLCVISVRTASATCDGFRCRCRSRPSNGGHSGHMVTSVMATFGARKEQLHSFRCTPIAVLASVSCVRKSVLKTNKSDLLAASSLLPFWPSYR